MQTKKTDIRQTILKVARKSFLNKGYGKTSMRNIAKEADVTLSNIYNYFKNKDEILEVILQPLFHEMEKMFNRHNDPYYATTQWFETENISEIEEYKEHVRFIVTYRKEFDLLLHKCSGSKYENIKDYFIDRYTNIRKSIKIFPIFFFIRQQHGGYKLCLKSYRIIWMKRKSGNLCRNI